VDGAFSAEDGMDDEQRRQQ
jgi:hypothetical protein